MLCMDDVLVRGESPGSDVFLVYLYYLSTTQWLHCVQHCYIVLTFLCNICSL